jgi:hypothetical protein
LGLWVGVGCRDVVVRRGTDGSGPVGGAGAYAGGGDGVPSIREMGGGMWGLGEFRFDEGIAAAAVSVDLGAGIDVVERDAAIGWAHDRGLNLVQEWPGEDEVPSCVLGRVAVPVRWERVAAEEPVVDERLWFEARCGGRDFLVGNGHTFPGRIAAWCPERRVAYNVSRVELGAMSDEARFWIDGFLAGAEPDPPEDGDEADLVAWRAATIRFHRTGRWFGRWRTCATCGCVLLPDSAGPTCAEHAGDARGRLER